MDPLSVVTREPSPSPVLLEGEGFRPRVIADFAEDGLNVRETTVALKKEELLRLLIANKTTREAANALGMSVGTVRTYIRCPEFQMKLWNHDQRLWSRVDEEIRQSKLSTTLRIQEMSEVALERIAELMEESADESIVLRASQDVLDRNPDTSKRTKQDTTSLSLTIDPAQLILAAQTAREMEAREREPRSRTILDGSSTTESK